MSKMLKVEEFAKVNEELLQKLEKFEFDIMPIGDDFHNDDEYIKEEVKFVKDDSGKWRRDTETPPEYYEVVLQCSTREKEFKNVTIIVKVTASNMDTIDGYDVDDAVKIKFDRKLTRFETNHKDILVLELYISEMKEVGANA